MLVPNKYESLSQNLLSLGKDIIEILKRNEMLVYQLYRSLVEKRDEEFEVNLDKFLFSLDMLFSLGLIELREGKVSLI